MFESTFFGFDFWGMGVGGFILALAAFYMVTCCIGCFLSGRGSNVDRGAGLVFVLVLIIPISIALSTGAYYGVQSAVAIVVERVEIERQCDGSSSSLEETKPSPMPKPDSGKWFSPHGNSEFGDSAPNGKPKINL